MRRARTGRTSMPRVVKQTFTTICSALADAKAGDTVHVSTSSEVEPTRYTIKSFTDTGGLLLVGVRAARRVLVIAPAEKTVWLCKRGHGRRVVQAWVEAKSDDVSPIIGDMRAAMYDTNAELVEARAQLKRLGGYIEALREVAPDAWDLTGNDLDDSATLAVCVGRLIHDLRALNSAHAELGRKLDAVETERDGMSRALCQLRNIANGVAPGTQPLPSNETPTSVVVTVSAAMLRLACGSPPVRMPNFYRDAIAGALPSRMQEQG